MQVLLKYIFILQIPGYIKFLVFSIRYRLLLTLEPILTVITEASEILKKKTLGFENKTTPFLNTINKSIMKITKI